MQEDFQRCAHESATELYRAALDMTSGDPKLEQLLCETLKTILTTCIEPLNKCFPAGDVEMMRSTTERDNKEFLVRILDGKVSAEAAGRCEVDNERSVQSNMR